VREVREEVGLRFKASPERVFKLTASPETDQEHVWVYRCTSEGPFTLNEDEIERGGWFAPEKVTRWIAERRHEFASAFVVIWSRQF
jgi:8-oxo-dGTP pyrophosphatase MutT (NUDIX family)